MPSKKIMFNTKMNQLANAINVKSGSTGSKNIDEMKTAVDSIVVPSGNKIIDSTAVTDVTAYATAQVIDNNLVSENIVLDVVILGVRGSARGATIESLTVTANGTYTAPSGTAYSPVVVSIPVASGVSF